MQCPQLPNGLLETIADSFEALPKPFERPTKLLQTDDNIVVANLEGKIIDSPFLQPWSDAMMAGFIDAACDFVHRGTPINVTTEVANLTALSAAAAVGQFTGTLPDHTETWSEGEDWKLHWKWGKTLPLKEEK